MYIWCVCKLLLLVGVPYTRSERKSLFLFFESFQIRISPILFHSTNVTVKIKIVDLLMVYAMKLRKLRNLGKKPMINFFQYFRNFQIQFYHISVYFKK